MKVLYKPLGIAFGVLGGILASSLFQRVWSLVSDADDAPRPRTSTGRGARSFRRRSSKAACTPSSRRSSTVAAPRASSA